MKLSDLIHRPPRPVPWQEGDSIPWHDPEFSRRMLAEHLSQEHNAASRRAAIIDRQIAWIHGSLLQTHPTRILDLGCGPGLYTSRLARLGHDCIGIDWSPASIEYARAEGVQEGLRCRYIRADLREAEFGEGFRLAMVIFGEFNVFRPSEARSILSKIHSALDPGGWLLLEPHTFAGVKEAHTPGARWSSQLSGLFSNRPHLLLEESFWDEAARAATTRFYMMDAESAEVTPYAYSMQAYSDEEYFSLLHETGFETVRRHPSLAGDGEELQPGLFALTARKPGA